MRIGRIDSPSTKLVGYIDGLIAANNSTNPNTQVDFGAGVAWCNDRLIENTSTRTKSLNATWTAGNNNGGRFSGVSLSADTWYHCFILRNSTTNLIDFGFDTSVTGANKPLGWDARLIWSVKTNSSSYITRFVQRGDACIWSVPPADINVSSYAATSTLFTLSTPAGISCEANVDFFYAGTGSDYAFVSDGDSDALDADYTAGRIDMQSGVDRTGQKRLITNPSSQIRFVASGNDSGYMTACTRSFIHPRGRR
jgi:hypothetical protein